jgi:hypothetical protein
MRSLLRSDGRSNRLWSVLAVHCGTCVINRSQHPQFVAEPAAGSGRSRSPSSLASERISRLNARLALS